MNWKYNEMEAQESTSKKFENRMAAVEKKYCQTSIQSHKERTTLGTTATAPFLTEKRFFWWSCFNLKDTPGVRTTVRISKKEILAGLPWVCELLSGERMGVSFLSEGKALRGSVGIS